MDWRIEHSRGAASAFHALPMPDPAERTVWFFEVDRPALVLGLSQNESAVDRSAAAASGVDVVRRRSGGGAVLMVPGEVFWVDVLVPADDGLWNRDASKAAWWIGDAWVRALTTLGIRSADVHHGHLQRTEWSSLVCFDGRGPGEVFVAGRKVVGISQRRTRTHARFQCALYRLWDPARLLTLLAPPRPRVEELAPVMAVTAEAEEIETAFAAALPA